MRGERLRGIKVSDQTDITSSSSSAYHGLHRLPALRLRARQQETLRIPSEIHLQIDIEVHGASAI